MEKKNKSWWVRNTGGKPDAMLTFALFSFIVVTLNIFLSTFSSVTIGETMLQFEALDSSIMAVYLGATFTAYVSRRYTDTRFQGHENREATALDSGDSTTGV